MVDKAIKFFLENKLVTALLVVGMLLWGYAVMPFRVEREVMPRDPVPVDAIPDIGENQQIVFTEWKGRSPQDVEDQVTYPLTIALQGVAGVQSVRSFSMFGFSNIFIIFDERTDFYWSRSRILEKLNVAQRDLPEGVTPTLGPDATALGQVFWYTLEGRGFDLEELRSVQDWYVKYALESVPGVSEVASVGGYVREYQIDIDPNAMRTYDVTLEEIMRGVRESNVDVGARTIEFNNVEYVVRGVGFIKDLQDLEEVVISVEDNIPVYVRNVANVKKGPALRRGALNKEGAEAVGGIVVVRHGENPMTVIERVKDKIKEIEPGLPQSTLEDGTVSRMEIVPYYDRTELIEETLGTLGDALVQQILITVLVIMLFLVRLRVSMVVSMILPMAVLVAFIMMKLFKVDANLMSLAGIAIAIGTIVDMGIIMCENIVRHLNSGAGEKNKLRIIYEAASEVGSAIITAIATTIVSFLAVFTMTGSEGRLFRPLAFTKTFALFASVLFALFVIPTLGHLFFVKREKNVSVFLNKFFLIAFMVLGVIVGFRLHWMIGTAILFLSAYSFFKEKIPFGLKDYVFSHINMIAIGAGVIVLARVWMPLGFGKGIILNLFFVAGLIFGIFFLFSKFMGIYPKVLMFFLGHKRLFAGLASSVFGLGIIIWLGFSSIFSPVTVSLSKLGVSEETVYGLWPLDQLDRAFPGLGKEFMPPLDEGSYLYMPTTMPHASMGEALDVLAKQNTRIAQIPEVLDVVGKVGRAESSLDPAPLSMIETVITYKPEYGSVEGRRGGRQRLWRDHIRTPDDIWDEIVEAAQIPGTTSAPRLQPIMARLVMLQSGMRAPMGVKVLGADLDDIEEVGFQIERFLKEVPSVKESAVFADRVVGKPYLEFHIDRTKAARYGANILDVQNVIEAGIGGKEVTSTVEGRERYPVRVRYQRELRDSVEEMLEVLVPTADGGQVPISQVAELNFVRGPQVIKSEDTFLVSYVLFDKEPGYAEVDVVRAAQGYLEQKRETGEFILPPGTSYHFAGEYEQQVRSERTLAVILPLSLFVIFIILYLQFKKVSTTLLVFSGIALAFCGGFILIWFYGQEWFGRVPFMGDYWRQVFNMGSYNLSVAVWVGFLALFGIATDDGVVIATYLDQSFSERDPRGTDQIRQAVLEAGNKRIRPCLMTTATTILALVPILTSAGRGSDVMIPMALPAVGGMSIALMTLFVVPVGYSWVKEKEAGRKAFVLLGGSRGWEKEKEKNED